MSSPADVEIRAAVPSDAAAVLPLVNLDIRDTLTTFRAVERSLADLAEEIEAKARNGQPFLVASQADRVLGFATYGQFRGNDGYRFTMEHTITLVPEARGRGIGRRLMAGIESQARAAGHHSLIAGVSGGNPDGVAFHKAVGFAEVAVLPQVGFKKGQWMDLIILQKMLDGA